MKEWGLVLPYFGSSAHPQNYSSPIRGTTQKKSSPKLGEVDASADGGVCLGKVGLRIITYSQPQQTPPSHSDTSPDSGEDEREGVSTASGLRGGGLLVKPEKSPPLS